MYKNIIFDFGGVVVDFAPKDFLMDHFMNRRAEEDNLRAGFRQPGVAGSGPGHHHPRGRQHSRC